MTNRNRVPTTTKLNFRTITLSVCKSINPSLTKDIQVRHVMNVPNKIISLKVWMVVTASVKGKQQTSFTQVSAV